MYSELAHSLVWLKLSFCHSSVILRASQGISAFTSGLSAAFSFAALLSQWWTTTSDITAQGLIDLAVTKTLGHQDLGYLGGASWLF